MKNIKELENYICHLSLQFLSKIIEGKTKLKVKKSN